MPLPTILKPLPAFKVSFRLFLPFFLIIVLASLTYLAGSPPALATINNTVNFQGKVVNKTGGTNLITGTPACVKAGADTCDFRVRVWNHLTNTDETSGTGNLMFTQTFQDVEIGDYEGVFNLIINSCNSVTSGNSHWGTSTGTCTVVDDSDADSDPGVNFDRSDLYLEVGFATADRSGSLGTFSELFTRKSLTSVPSAFVAQTLSGIGSDGFVQYHPGTVQASGATTHPLIYLNENGTGTPNLIQLQTGGTDQFIVSNSGVASVNGYYSIDGIRVLSIDTAASNLFV